MRKFHVDHPPTEDEIEAVLQQIQDQLERPEVLLPINADAREGLEEAVDILADDRRTYAGIGRLKSTQGRAIAQLAVDYLNAEIPSWVLLWVPITVPNAKKNN